MNLWFIFLKQDTNKHLVQQSADVDSVVASHSHRWNDEQALVISSTVFFRKDEPHLLQLLPVEPQFHFEALRSSFSSTNDQVFCCGEPAGQLWAGSKHLYTCLLPDQQAVPACHLTTYLQVFGWSATASTSHQHSACSRKWGVALTTNVDCSLSIYPECLDFELSSPGIPVHTHLVWHYTHRLYYKCSYEGK